MVWTRFSDDWIRQVQSCVIDVMQYYIVRGHRKMHAIEQTALALELTPRKVKTIAYGEAYNPTESEVQRVRRAFLRHLDEQAEDLAKRSEQARMRRRQMELGL